MWPSRLLEDESASHIHTSIADYLHLGADSVSDDITKEKQQQTGLVRNGLYTMIL
jgi:hypothetical protein